MITLVEKLNFMSSFIRKAVYSLTVALHVGCFAHVIAEYVAELTLVSGYTI